MDSSPRRCAFVLVFVILLLALLPGARAQEQTQEPIPTDTPSETAPPSETQPPSPTTTDSPTQTPTEDPAAPTPTEAVSTPQPAESTAEATEETVVVTDEATPETPAPVVIPAPTADATLGPRGTNDGTPPFQPQIPQDGTRRVIVELNLTRATGPAAPGGAQTQTAPSRDQQAAEIAAAQNALASALAPYGAAIKHTYDQLPLMSLDVDDAGLSFLQHSPLVRGIQFDEMRFVDLENSTPVIGAAGVGGAWEMGYDGSGVTVAILDNSFQPDHPFYNGRVVAEACFSGSGIFDLSNCPNGSGSQFGAGASSNSRCVVNLSGFDDCSHGTHVAGIAAGSGGPNGRNGVAKGANLILVNVFSTLIDCNASMAGNQPCGVAWDSDILAGMNYVYSLRTTYTIASVNMSLGGGQFSSVCDASYPAYVTTAATLRTAGIVTIAASGNNGWTTSMSGPACVSNIISVGATTNLDQIAGFSNAAEFLDFWMPGFQVNSSTPNSSYGIKSGTSMATPHLAGAWAVMRQRAPEASIQSIYNVFRATGTFITDITGFSFPRVNLDDALNRGMFDLLGPLPNEGLITTTPTFSWTTAANAASYELVVTNTATGQSVSQWFDATAICNSSTCAAVPTQGAASVFGNSALTWYVRAQSPVYGFGEYMGPLNFTVLAPGFVPGNPSYGPVNTMTAPISGDPVYSWDRLSGAAYYQLVVTGAGGAELINTWLADSACGGGPICQFHPTTVLNNGSYQWYVRAWSPLGYSAWRGPIAFTLSVGRPAAVMQVAPSGGVVVDTNLVTFEWQHSTGANYYELYVGNGSGMVHQRWYHVSELTPNGSSYQIAVQISGSGSFNWYVRGYGPGGFTLGGNAENWVGPASLNISTIPAPTGLNFSGANGDFTYSWDHQGRATYYELYIGTPAQQIHRRWYQVGVDAICAATCAVNPGITLGNGSYVWYVRAYSLAGYSTGGIDGWTQGSNINVNLPPADAASLNPSLPANGTAFADVDQPTFQWSDAANASWYELVIVNTLNGAILHQTWYRDALVCDGVLCSVTPNALYLTNGSYQWYVRAWGPAGYSTGGISGYAGPLSFTVSASTAIASVSPVLDAVTNTTTPSPTFSWQETPGATWYQLYVANATNGAVAFQQWRHYNNTCDTICAWSPPVTLANGSYIWHVQAYGPGGLSLWSGYNPGNGTYTPGSFNIAVPPPAAVTLLAPGDADIELDNLATFQWSAVDNATYYNLELKQGSTVVSAQWYVAAAICTSGVCSVSLPVGAGTYTWTVYSYGPGTTGTPYPAPPVRSLLSLE